YGAAYGAAGFGVALELLPGKGEELDQPRRFLRLRQPREAEFIQHSQAALIIVGPFIQHAPAPRAGQLQQGRASEHHPNWPRRRGNLGTGARLLRRGAVEELPQRMRSVPPREGIQRAAVLIFARAELPSPLDKRLLEDFGWLVREHGRPAALGAEQAAGRQH